MKKSHVPMTFTFSLPFPFWFSLQISFKIATPTQFFGYSIFLLQKKSWGFTGALKIGAGWQSPLPPYLLPLIFCKDVIVKFLS